MYYIVKRYFLPEPTWLRAPHWCPVAYETWDEVIDAYVRQRLRNVRALGVPGYPAADIRIEYVAEEEQCSRVVYPQRLNGTQ